MIHVPRRKPNWFGRKRKNPVVTNIGEPEPARCERCGNSQQGEVTYYWLGGVGHVALCIDSQACQCHYQDTEKNREEE